MTAIRALSWCAFSAMAYSAALHREVHRSLWAFLIYVRGRQPFEADWVPLPSAEILRLPLAPLARLAMCPPARREELSLNLDPGTSRKLLDRARHATIATIITIMAKNKRPREEPADQEIDGNDVHPARQKRLKRTKDDAELATIYEELSNEVQEVRNRAAARLLKSITKDSNALDERLDAAEKRLIRGLCSGRRAARLGFSVTLAEVFRLRLRHTAEAAEGISLSSTLSNIAKFTQAEGNVGGQERRDHLLGRRFAYQAVLQSDVALEENLKAPQWSALLNAIFDFANEKAWLRREVGSMLHDYLSSPSGSKLSPASVSMLMETAGRKKLLRTPEGVGLWLVVRQQFPAAETPSKIWHRNDPLSSKEHQNLAKIMLEHSADDEPTHKRPGSRQSIPSFAWTMVLQQLSDKRNASRVQQFWEYFVSMVFSASSSTERKALGLQIFSLAVSDVSAAKLSAVFDTRVLRCVLDQRAKADNHLFEAAKLSLDAMVARAKQEPTCAGVLVSEIIDKAAINFDQLSKTKTVESIVAFADNISLKALIEKTRKTCLSSVRREESEVDFQLRGYADLLLTMVRTHKDAGADLTMGTQEIKLKEDWTWLEELLRFLSFYAFHDKDVGPIFQPRLMSILSLLMHGPLQQALQAPVIVVQPIRLDGNALNQLKGPAADAVEKAWKCFDKMYRYEPGTRKVLQPGNEAFALLFALSILQCFRHEPDAAAALEDLINCYQVKDSTTNVTAMIIELLLSFISKPSALFRKLAEQVFTVFAPELTADSLQSLIDILGQKESLSGQQELFDAHGDDDEDGADGEEESESGDHDFEAIDVEDASDVELVNGEEASASGSNNDDDSEDDESASDAADGATNGVEDEEAAFDRKLAEALGTGRAEDEDSDEDGSDMDDEQMMALEPHLTTIFKERQKNTSKKQEKKDAKENIVNFKNRVLDLLAIFVKTQYAEVLTLDLILPLTNLVRTTTNKQTAEKAFAVLKQYFDACSKNKKLPQPEDDDAVFMVLEAVHDEMKLGGSKLHANACSRSSLFLAKVLVAEDPGHYERVASMYAKLMSEWWQDPTSKVQPSVFTEWTSWSITTRKRG
ncbi:DNA-directed DNA polymerase [Saxophila tyrrhenica]|uniref:DNA-directed DNA polymerase n=1 Tax=Saxophila tyrrhenica TaxID=1690608 RepID=A0AAV9P9T5_9PEZI|nr:DNA-directed DNA polymerase [Saxophila tyrrhenica]